MKKIILIATMFFIGAFTVNAQKITQNDVPQAVKTHFEKNYVKATDVEWKKNGNNYGVEFEMGIAKYDHKIWYDSNGKIIQQTEEISKNDLPAKITSAISINFKGYKIDDVKKISEGRNLTYRVELDGTTNDWKVVFDKDGKILNKIQD